MTMKQQIYTRIDQVKDILEINGECNVFLVTGPSSYELSGAKLQLKPILTKYNVTYYSEFAKNPKVEDVQKGIDLFRKSNSKIILAVGGGSVLDMGKSIAHLAKQPLEAVSYITKKAFVTETTISLIAIPTTSGSGSEATHFAVVYIDKQKYSLAHESMLPKYVILDPHLTESLPPRITASTTMDALSQAMESYWSVASTEESRTYAKESLALTLKYAVVNYRNPNIDSRAAMQKAANLAGKAINISKTTACHALSYTFTSYFNIPHGHAVGLTLGSLFEYNAAVNSNDCNDPREIEYVQQIFCQLKEILGVSSSKEAAVKINLIMKEMKLETSLSNLNIGDCSDLSISEVNLERLGNNPRKIGAREIKEIILSIQ